MDFFRTLFRREYFRPTPVISALLAGLAVGTVSLAFEPSQERWRSSATHAFALQPLPMTVPGLQPDKMDKQYPRFRRPYRRPGVIYPLTTVINLRTRQVLPVFEHVALEPEHLRELFQCRGFGTSVDLDPKLIEAAVAAAVQFKSPEIFVVSAYRSPKFNESLAKKGRHVAAESRHMEGQALDFRLSTVEAKVLGPWMFETFEGGVGTYVRDNFVHIDVGPKRRWGGN